MRRHLFKGWARIAWHLDGMTFDRYLRLTWTERFILHEELSDLIEIADPKIT